MGDWDEKDSEDGALGEGDYPDDEYNDSASDDFDEEIGPFLDDEDIEDYDEEE